MVNKKVICELNDMSIDKSLKMVYNINKDDGSRSMVIKTAAEIVGIRLEDKAPHSRLVGNSKHDKKKHGGKNEKVHFPRAYPCPYPDMWGADRR